MKKSDLLAEKFEKLIRAYDDEKEISEKDYKKMGKLFSAVARTSPEIREMFFDNVKELAKSMRKNFEEMNKDLMEQILVPTKEKIIN